MAPARGTQRRPTNVYSNVGLYRACQQRQFEEMRIPLGTDRVMNDLLRLKFALHELSATVDDETEDHDRRINSLESESTEYDNRLRELEV